MSTGQVPKKRQTSIAIVTPWRDHLELAHDYFLAVEGANPDQLVVVDDGSEEELTFAALRVPRLGFCGANNAGLELVETEAVVFLNNDIAALRPNWLDDIREKVMSNVMLGPLRFDKHGDVDGVNYPYVDGWCCAMMTTDIRRIGGWDVAYDRAGPAYFSDNAISFQARLHGMTLRELLPGLRHKGGQTGGRGLEFSISLTVNRPLWEAQVREVVGG